MKKKNIHNAILIIVAIGVGLSGLLLLRSRYISTAPVVSDNTYNRTLTTGAATIHIAVANTEQSRQQGLSDTTSLPPDSGMLFVFDTPAQPGFWMKDMNYALDFVWLDNNMDIVAITPDVAATTYPQIFYPPQPIQYVLEVNADFSTIHHLSVGQKLELR